MQITNYTLKVKHGNTGIVGNSAGLNAVMKDAVTGIVANLTGRSYSFIIKDGATTLLSKTIGYGITVTPLNGAILVSLTREEILTLPANRILLYELEEIIGATETTILHGRVVVEKGINSNV